MANRHTDDANDEAGQKGDVTDRSGDGDSTEDGRGVSASRRSVLKGAAATAATLGSVGALTQGATAQQGFTVSPSGEVVLEPGEYTWDDGFMDIGSGDALVGGGNPGDVVVNLESTMEGSVEGRFENIVIRGPNPDSTSSLDPLPGATIDGFIWPEGGQQSRDRAFYTPEGGDERVTIRNSAWAWNVNNGAYCDKPAMTFENCVAVNNNIAGIRVGHRRGTDVNETSYIRNCLIAVTDDIPSDDVNSPNARGVRIRRPGNFVIENCYFVYLDVSGAASPIVVHDDAADSSITVRNCKFYNETGNSLLNDKTGGSIDVTVENCVAVGGGSTEFEAGDVSDSDLQADGEVAFPLPSDVTGYAAADEIEGVGSGIGPWSGSVQMDDGGQTQEEYDHTIALHAHPDNPGTADVQFVVDGSVGYGPEAEQDQDAISDNGDGTSTVTSTLGPDGLDSFRYSGAVVDYTVPDGYKVDISVDGATTTFQELVGQDSDGQNTDGQDSDGQDSDGQTTDGQVFEIESRSTNTFSYEFEVDGAVEMVDLNSNFTTGHGDSVDSSGETTVVTGFTGNTGYGDAYRVYGEILRFTITDGDADYVLRLDGETVTFDSSSGDSTDDSTGGTGDDGSSDGSTDDGSSGGSTDDGSSDGSTDGTTEDLPHVLTVNGTGSGTQYTFTVSGDVVRDAGMSQVTDDSMQFDWDSMEDIAQDGKVIGVVGSGVDAYRFSGSLTAMTVDGDAEVSVTRDA